MKNLLSDERAKWLLLIGIVAIGAGITANNVISYPTECQPKEITQSFHQAEEQLGSL